MGEKGERRRQELLQIAYRLFTEQGYDNTSVDEIIAAAGIAKGTYYYHFPSKEATLEAVIDMMLNEEIAQAKTIVSAPLPVPQKIAAVIMAFHPKQEEISIANALEAKENIVLHEKLNRRVIEEATPLLAEIVQEGISQALFCCGQVPERVRMLLLMSMQMFDENTFTENDITVFIDMTEKMLGAQPGTMAFLRALIH